MKRSVCVCSGLMLAWSLAALAPALASEPHSTKRHKHSHSAAAKPRHTDAPANVALPKIDQIMQVMIVRSSEPGCEPGCAEWISAQGTIDSTTPARFRQVLSQLGQRKLPVLIDSLGGTVDDSLKIGRMIRAKGLDVVVTKTLLEPCASFDRICGKLKLQGVARGLPQARLSKCASACAFVLAAGTRRYVGPYTFVGVHQAVAFQKRWKILRKYRVETIRSFGVPIETRKTLISEQKLDERITKTNNPKAERDKISAYFSEMGIAPSIMPLVNSATPDNIHVLTLTELKSTHLATDFVQGETLLLGAAADAPGPVTTTSPTEIWRKMPARAQP